MGILEPDRGNLLSDLHNISRGGSSETTYHRQIWGIRFQEEAVQGYSSQTFPLDTVKVDDQAGETEVTVWELLAPLLHLLWPTTVTMHLDVSVGQADSDARQLHGLKPHPTGDPGDCHVDVGPESEAIHKAGGPAPGPRAV